MPSKQRERPDYRIANPGRQTSSQAGAEHGADQAIAAADILVEQKPCEQCGAPITMQGAERLELVCGRCDGLARYGTKGKRTRAPQEPSEPEIANQSDLVRAAETGGHQVHRCRQCHQAEVPEEGQTCDGCYCEPFRANRNGDYGRDFRKRFQDGCVDTEDKVPHQGRFRRQRISKADFLAARIPDRHTDQTFDVIRGVGVPNWSPLFERGVLPDRECLVCRNKDFPKAIATLCLGCGRANRGKVAPEAPNDYAHPMFDDRSIEAAKDFRDRAERISRDLAKFPAQLRKQCWFEPKPITSNEAAVTAVHCKAVRMHSQSNVEPLCSMIVKKGEALMDMASISPKPFDSQKLPGPAKPRRSRKSRRSNGEPNKERDILGLYMWYVRQNLTPPSFKVIAEEVSCDPSLVSKVLKDWEDMRLEAERESRHPKL